MRKRESAVYGLAFLVAFSLAALPVQAQLNPCDPDNCPVGCNLIFGTAGNDWITGTNGCDCIYGLAGNDCLFGLDGNDILCGGDGIDLLRGDAGSDKSYGEAGNDQLCTEIQDGGSGTDACQNLTGYAWINCENFRSGCPMCSQLPDSEP